MRERRQEDYAGRPPCLRTALRQLRLRVIEAQGPGGVKDFIARAKGVATLAVQHNEPEVSRMLLSLSAGLANAGQRDAREAIYGYIDRIADKIRGD